MSILLILSIVAAGLLAVVVLVVNYKIKTRRSIAVITKDKVQEIMIVVNGRYRPDTITLKKGIPARLNFLRQENNPCSERVIFSAFNVERHLPAFRTTPVVFMPDRVGVFLFTCEMGLYRGWLIVKETDNRSFISSAEQINVRTEEC